MSLNRRLHLTYILALIVTMILMVTVMYATHGLKVIPRLDKTEKGEHDDNLISYTFQFSELNSIEQANRYINRLFFIDNLDDSSLKDREYWENVESNFRHSVSMIVRTNDQWLYQSDTIPESIEYVNFPEFGSMGTYPNEELFDKYEMTIQRQIDYKLDDGTELSIFLLMTFSSENGRFLLMLINNLAIFMIVAMLTMSVVSFFVVRSITKPLDQLIFAVDQVRTGNMKHEIKEFSRDKIGELSQAFEAMRKQLLENEDLREQYENNRRQMISSISHDLRTPITSIQLYAEGIMDGVAESPEKQMRYLQSMSNNAKVVDRLLKELTLFSNLDAERENFQFAEVNLIQFLSDLVEEWKYDYIKDEIHFEINSEVDLVPIQLDVIHFRRVMVNLVENAIKYARSADLILKLDVKMVSGVCRLIVNDNGSGVEPDQLQKIFERFHRVDEARQSIIPGSGLGLSIARQIVLKHNGRIWAENNMCGGLSICIELPVAEGERNGKDSNR